jgi:hypothetical protein
LHTFHAQKALPGFISRVAAWVYGFLSITEGLPYPDEFPSP